MTKSIDYFLKKIVSASDGPFLAEKLCDKISLKIIKHRKGKGRDNVFSKWYKSNRNEELENLELAIFRVMRQTNEKFRERYEYVIDRIHSTGMDPLFKGPIPPPIKKQKEEKDAAHSSTNESGDVTVL